MLGIRLTGTKDDIAQMLDYIQKNPGIRILGISEYFKSEENMRCAGEVFRCYVEVGNVSEDADSLVLLKEKLEAAGRELKYLKHHAVDELRSVKKWCQYEPDLDLRIAEARKRQDEEHDKILAKMLWLKKQIARIEAENGDLERKIPENIRFFKKSGK